MIVDLLKSSCRMIYELCDLLLFGAIYITTPSKNIDDVMSVHSNITSTCSETCNNICYEIGWKYCEAITVINTFYYKSVVPAFHKYTNYYFRNDVIVIKDGIEVMCFKNVDGLRDYTEPIEFDFILHTTYELNDIKKNYTAVYDNKNVLFDNILENKCSINFIVFQVVFDGNTYDVNLKEPMNFLVKNNILRYPFFKWYMKHTYDVELSHVFQVNYMTQDMTFGNLLSPFFIKFNTDGVTSFSSGKPNLTVNIPKNADDDQETIEEEIINETNVEEDDIFEFNKDI